MGRGGKPKKKCCESKPQCDRCPIRMLKEGRLPEGYTVHRRRLVKAGKGASGEAGGPKGRKKRG